MLASPSFLYRSELGVERDDGLYELQGYELASTLSFFLWGMGPDAELLAAAGSGELDTPEGLRDQARRMLEDPRATAQQEAFAVQWLGVGNLATMTKNADFGHDDRRALLAEASSFVAHAETVDELLSSPDAYPGEAGVLGLGAVLAATAHSDQTSPIRRGLFVREQLLCEDLGTPPADAGGVPDVDPNASTRERFEQHSNDPACSSCHQFIDPVGFGFEHWDEVGQWRDMDGEHEIDVTGALVSMDDGSSQPFEGIAELGELLADTPKAEACYAEKTLSLAVGDTVPGCVGEELATNDLDALMLAIVTSDTFRIRE
jgi:hypothetical protein